MSSRGRSSRTRTPGTPPPSSDRRARSTRARLRGRTRRPRPDAHRPAERPRIGKHSESGSNLGVLGGLAALSLDAISSVAYGPEAMILVLVTAGTAALSWTVPLTLVIAAMLAILVISYTQVVAAHPEGGGAYAVSKANLGRRAALLAAAAVVVDYVLTVAVSLSSGAASLGSVFPGLAHHLLLVSLVGLVLLTTVNMFGLSASARLLMLPTVIFIVSIFAMIVFGAVRTHPVAQVGTYLGPITPTAALGIILILKAFASGCSAVTGVEAISNGAPAFREPRVRTAGRTEVSLGALLGVMLIGLALVIHARHIVPRGGVTILAQVSAGSFGTGWPFYVSNLAVALVLGLAANTSFGGLPVLMNLLARDNRLPHLFYLRAEQPIYRTGIVALALLAALVLVIVGAQTPKLIPLFTIGVFLGFTLSQIGLVLHWRRKRPRHWLARAVLNGVGATVTAIAVVVFVLSKFLAGAWLVVLAIPLLMIMFSRIERYYAKVAAQLRLGERPPQPRAQPNLVVLPVATVTLLTERALSAGLSLGDRVVPLAVAGDEEERQLIEARVGGLALRRSAHGGRRSAPLAGQNGPALRQIAPGQ